MHALGAHELTGGGLELAIRREWHAVAFKVRRSGRVGGHSIPLNCRCKRYRRNDQICSATFARYAMRVCSSASVVAAIYASRSMLASDAPTETMTLMVSL